MCGIVGYVGNRPVVDLLMKGLKTLEYRGYDSSGIAYSNNGKIQIQKSEGKLSNLAAILDNVKMKGFNTGMGHTRWATHGRPTTQNAHPHRAGHVVLIHNGIIENFREIKAELISRGHRPESETDSELFGFLVLEEMERGLSLKDAACKSFLKLEGSCSFVLMSEKEPGKILGLSRGTPLVAGVDPEGGGVLSSDAQAILEITQKVVFLNENEGVMANEKGLEFFEIESQKTIQPEVTEIDWSADQLSKNGYSHYFIKEMMEQPSVIVDTINSVLDRSKTVPFSFMPQPGVELLRNAKSLTIVACGTSYYAALLGKYWIEKWARVPVNVEIASEFRYRTPVLLDGTVVVGISQSGETADTLAVLQDMKAQKIPTIALTNVRGSTMSRVTDATFYISAGPEICVLATKSFTAMNVMLLLWAGGLGYDKALRTNDQALKLELDDVFQQLVRLPHLFEEMLQDQSKPVQTIRSTAKKYQNKKGFFFMGRGTSYVLALEGALKLKECAYIHAEGYPAGELKHGPLAMIDQDMVVVVFAPKDQWREKTVSNLQEVKARGAVIFGVGQFDDEMTQSLCDVWVSLPETAKSLDPSLIPFLLTPVVQYLSYEISLLKGTDIDQPRNLAKSVTVE